jgi:hypothetical protein
MALFSSDNSSQANNLYSGVQSPFKNVPDFLPSALSELNRTGANTPTPQQKLSDPVQTMLDSTRPVALPDALKTTKSVPQAAFLDNSPTPKFGTTDVFDPLKFAQDTARQESGGDPNAKSKTSSATGKYQFLWNTWGNSIRAVTGISNEQDFRKNPGAQDKFFTFYTKHVIQPEVQQLMPFAQKYNLTQNDVARLVHFRGAAGAERALKGNQLNTKLESNNPTINQYLGRAK